ncbi:hypothetical protein GGH97_004208 [Coemansia sp. RSA 475]|nr:hypothetical protein GGH97_004208 [Coemansia sp. RSA 475]
MDLFLKNIKSQTYALNGWDFISAFANIPFTFYFKNPGQSDFMSSSLLRASFLRTLQEFPIMAGHLVVRDTRGYIVVDKNNLNMPEYAESQSCIDYKFVEAGKFSWDALPHPVSTVTAVPSKGANRNIKLVNVNVVRLRNNSGVALFVNMPHYVVDGYGYAVFVRRWAEVCTWMHDDTYENELPLREFVFDRAVVRDAMPTDMLPLDDACSRMYEKTSTMGHLLAWMSPETRGDVLVTGTKLMPANGHIFHVSRNTINKLRSRVEQSGLARRVSDNDVLAAMISQCVAQGVHVKSRTRRMFSSLVRSLTRPLLERNNFLSLIIVDARPRLEKLMQMAPAQYVGGCITGVPVINSTHSLIAAASSDKQFSSIASSVRSVVDTVSDKYMSGIDNALNRNPACFAHSLALSITTPEKVIITNQSRFGLYECDFGFGAPKWIAPMATFLTNFASVLPVGPNHDGYHVYLSVEKYVMNDILSNGFWSTHTSLVY